MAEIISLAYIYICASLVWYFTIFASSLRKPTLSRFLSKIRPSPNSLPDLIHITDTNFFEIAQLTSGGYLMDSMNFYCDRFM